MTVGIVRDRDPVGFRDRLDQRPDRLALLDPDRELDTLAVQCTHQLVVLKSRVGPDHDRAVMTRAGHAREQFIHEPGGAALRVGLPFAVADVQHLTGIAAHGDDRVIPELAGVP